MIKWLRLKTYVQSERMLTYTRLFFVHNLRLFSSSDTYDIADDYKDIDWKRCNYVLAYKQAEIVRAYRKKDLKRVFTLQQELIRSFAARALAVKKATSNKGKVTPGIDNIIWLSDNEKMNGIKALKNLKNYKAQPVRRVYIPKRDGTLRPLGIPTIFDRSVQTLWYFALAPIAEETADKQSYGFRPYRSVHDCATYLKLVCGSYTATRRYVLDADISKFFDTISHDWLIENIPMDKHILREFLKAGFLFKATYEDTPEGFPQGGVISPIITNMTLDGLQIALGKEFLFTRYADDFIVLGKTIEALKKNALPTIENSLKPRGLKLNLNKTQIHSLKEGFEYLGLNFREYPDPSRIKGIKKGIFLVKPSTTKNKEFRRKISDIVKNHSGSHITALIINLNPVLRGWAEHYRTCASTKAFNNIGKHVFSVIWRMLIKRFRNVPKRIIAKRFFCRVGNNRWVLYGPPLKLPGSKKEIDKVTLFQMGYVKKRRHILCKPLNCYDPDNYYYFQERVARIPLVSWHAKKLQEKLYTMQKGICPVCDSPLQDNFPLEIHHVIPKRANGNDQINNLKLLHQQCHLQVTHTKNPKLLAAFKASGIIK